MEIDCVMLASYAEVGQDGKVSMIGGGVDTFQSQFFPFKRLLPIFLAARMTFDNNEVGINHALRIELLSPDGQSILVIENTLTPPTGQHGHLPVINSVAIFDLIFQNPGIHHVRLSISGRELRKIPLYVEKI